VDMLWCQGVQNIGLSNHKLKSALTCADIDGTGFEVTAWV